MLVVAAGSVAMFALGWAPVPSAAQTAALQATTTVPGATTTRPTITEPPTSAEPTTTATEPPPESTPPPPPTTARRPPPTTPKTTLAPATSAPGTTAGTVPPTSTTTGTRPPGTAPAIAPVITTGGPAPTPQPPLEPTSDGVPPAALLIGLVAAALAAGSLAVRVRRRPPTAATPGLPATGRTVPRSGGHRVPSLFPPPTTTNTAGPQPFVLFADSRQHPPRVPAGLPDDHTGLATLFPTRASPTAEPTTGGADLSLDWGSRPDRRS